MPFENSLTGDPSEVQCEPDLPGDIYLSAEMSGEDQAALMR
jgi:ribose transport system substrate-binding protein